MFLWYSNFDLLVFLDMSFVGVGLRGNKEGQGCPKQIHKEPVISEQGTDFPESKNISLLFQSKLP